MMEKIKGDDMVTKLREIPLYEADFNHNNKIFGREMMWVVESANILAPEHYGSKKLQYATGHALNK